MNIFLDENFLSNIKKFSQEKIFPPKKFEDKNFEKLFFDNFYNNNTNPKKFELSSRKLLDILNRKVLSCKNEKDIQSLSNDITFAKNNLLLVSNSKKTLSLKTKALYLGTIYNLAKMIQNCNSEWALFYLGNVQFFLIFSIGSTYLDLSTKKNLKNFESVQKEISNFYNSLDEIHIRLIKKLC